MERLFPRLEIYSQNFDYKKTINDFYRIKIVHVLRIHHKFLKGIVITHNDMKILDFLQ